MINPGWARLLILATFFFVVQKPQAANIRGTTRDAETTEKLSSVSVELVGQTLKLQLVKQGVLSSDSGTY